MMNCQQLVWPLLSSVGNGWLQLRRLLFRGVLLVWLVGATLMLSAPAAASPLPAVPNPKLSLMSHGLVASLHTYQEQPGQLTFRSKLSLRDRADRSWQVITFKRYQADRLQGLYLRLVGFPGLVAVDAISPLKIATGASLQWQATPTLDPQTPALPDYAAQYDVADVLSALQGDIPLQLEISLADGGIAEVVVPPFAVHEWRELLAQSPATSPTI
ncbi:MAG: DUF3122 domain-containing protein [Cyanobacteria bacterium J06659_2]